MNRMLLALSVVATLAFAGEDDDWSHQIKMVRSKYNQQINQLIERRDILYVEMEPLIEKNGTARAEQYTQMNSIITNITDLLERRDSEVAEINKNKRAHHIERQPVDPEFLAQQQAEAARLQAVRAKEADANAAAADRASKVRELRDRLQNGYDAIRAAEKEPPPAPATNESAKTMQAKLKARTDQLELLRARAAELEAQIKAQ